MTLLAYADRRSCRPGDVVTVFATTDGTSVSAELFRLLDGVPDTAGSPARVEAVIPAISATGRGTIQQSTVGSFADLPLPAGWPWSGPLVIRCWVYPTTAGLPANGLSADASHSRMASGGGGRVEHRRQVIWAIGEAGQPATLALAFAADGRIVVEAAGKQIASTQRPVWSRQWCGVLVTVDGEAARLDVSSAVGDRYAIEHIEHVSGAVRLGGPANLLRIGRDVAANLSDSFNGKVARPGVASGALAADTRRLLESDVPLTGQIVVEWDFALRPETDVVAARGAAGLDGRLTNLPGRAMTGPFWQPAAGQLFALSSHHDAIHFHADDVGDLHWKPTLQLRLPENLESGFYAIRISGSDGYMHVPLFVRPKTPGARVVFLASTNTYLAYANHRMFFGNDALHELIATHPVVPNDRDVLVLDRPFLGRSLYDLHDDGSGVHMASWNRPLISLEPEARDFLAAGPRNYQADLYVIGWLRRHAMPFDVITDEDLDREGVAALAPYDVVIAGGHPEYWSRRMLEGLQQRLRTGGKLMYLGGNGFYWAVGYNPDRTALEVRRGAGGTRPWEVSAGEIMLSTTGEAGGAWRTLGLAPQSVVGIGFASQGWGGGRGYRRLSDSLDPRVASFFDGIAKDEIIGDFGIVMNGAAGDEVDRIDYNLGTPAHTLRLATSLPFPDQYQLAVDDIRNMTPTYGGSQTELVRADIVWFDLPNGGEVFSVGSVSWPAAIGWNEGDNNVDRLSTNVLRAFLERAPKR